MKQKISNLRLQTKIILIVLLAVVMVGSASFLGMQYLSKTYDTFAYTALSNSLSTVAAAVDNHLESIEDVSSSIFSHQMIQDDLDKIHSSPSEKHWGLERDIASVLNSYLSWSNHAMSLNILLPNDNNIAYSATAGGPSDEVMEFYRSVEQDAIHAEGENLWVISPDNNMVVCARAIRKIKNLELTYLGTLVIQVDLNSLVRSAIQRTGQTTNFRFAITTQDSVIYPKNNFPDIFDQPMEGTYNIIQVGNEKEFAATRNSPITGWTYFILTPYNQVFHSISVARLVVMLVLFASIVLAVTLAVLFGKGVMIHFETLFAKMNRFKSGVLTPLPMAYDYSTRKDEVGKLHHNFDDMLFEISSLIEDNYMKQILIKDAQLKALEQQINPHFLYNTLDYLYWTARAKNDEEISQIVKSLAFLLRTTLSNPSEKITLQDELTIIEHYLEIQVRRFEDRLHFHHSIPPELLKIKVPKMCLQPLVENAIHHSVEETTELCTITLTGWQTDNGVYLRVTNDNSTIDENIMEKLEYRQAKPKGHGIGLANIHNRIQLMYGKEYGLTLQNQDDLVMITVHLPAPEPKDKGESSDDTTDDSGR